MLVYTPSAPPLPLDTTLTFPSFCIAPFVVIASTPNASPSLDVAEIVPALLIVPLASRVLVAIPNAPSLPLAATLTFPSFCIAPFVVHTSTPYALPLLDVAEIVPAFVMFPSITCAYIALALPVVLLLLIFPSLVTVCAVPKADSINVVLLCVVYSAPLLVIFKLPFVPLKS